MLAPKVNKRYLSFFICMLISLLPNIACMILSTDINYSWIKEVGYLIVVLICFLLPMTFLKRRTYFIVEGILGLFWGGIEIASLYLNGMTVSPHFMAIIFETNRIEATELLSSVCPLLIIVIGTWIVYWWLVVKMENDYILPSVLRKITWICLPILAILGVVCSLFLLPNRSNDCYPKDNLLIAMDKTAMKFQKIYPWDIYLASISYFKEQMYIHELDEQLETFHFGIIPQNDTIEEHYILIIGEAARYDHFHINGYSRLTSPSLDTIASLYSMGNCYSEANLTRNAVNLMITRADLDNRERAFREKSILEAFAEAGYQTAWLSCQTLMDFEKRIALTADYYYEQVSTAKAQLDSILPYKAQILFDSLPARKSFYIFHPLGSHLKYDQRYSKDFEQFAPSVTSRDGYAVLSAENKDRIINAYDNTILYTDYMISRSIDVLRHQKGLRGLIYVSDHGENLFDDERELSVHGSYEGSIYEAHVPCFVWLSDEFKNAYPDKIAALKANLDKQIQSDVIFYSLADMGNLNKIVNSEKSIFSPSLVEQDTIRMMTGNGTIKIIK